MPNRILKESICVSDDIDRLSWFEEVVFYRLLVNCDDYGRFDGRPAVLKNRLFPLKESVTLKSVTEAIHTLASAGLVVLYENEGKPYLYIPTWAKHQNIRAKRSRYPEPPTEEHDVNTDDSICKQGSTSESKSPRTRTRESESEKESESSSEGARPRAEAAGLPDDTVLSLAHPVNLVGSESERDKYLRDVLHL
mgnify:CR=1 FL=1